MLLRSCGIFLGNMSFSKEDLQVMESQSKNSFSDHPEPGSGLITIMALFLIGFLAAVPAVLLADISLGIRVASTLLLVICLSILIYAFWLIHHVWYKIDPEGVVVIYGPAEASFSWSEFKDARHKPGVFGLKIGWLRVTPCVRLKNAVVLRRQHSRVPLFLTPSDPREFLDRIRPIQPSLIK